MVFALNRIQILVMSPKIVLGGIDNASKKGSWSSISRFKSFCSIPGLEQLQYDQPSQAKIWWSDQPPRMGESNRM